MSVPAGVDPVTYYADLLTELQAGHPVTGPYSADVSAATVQINALNCETGGAGVGSTVFSSPRPSRDIETAFVRMGATVWQRLRDRALDVTVRETDEAPDSGVTRQLQRTQDSLYPFTARLIDTFTATSALFADVLNTASPTAVMILDGTVAEGNLGAGASAQVQALCYVTVSRGTWLWGMTDLSDTGNPPLAAGSVYELAVGSPGHWVDEADIEIAGWPT